MLAWRFLPACATWSYAILLAGFICIHIELMIAGLTSLQPETPGLKQQTWSSAVGLFGQLSIFCPKAIWWIHPGGFLARGAQTLHPWCLCSSFSPRRRLTGTPISVGRIEFKLTWSLCLALPVKPWKNQEFAWLWMLTVAANGESLATMPYWYRNACCMFLLLDLCAFMCHETNRVVEGAPWDA